MVNGEPVDGSRRIVKVEDMPVYQKVYGLALQIEGMTRGFQQDFRWLRNQILRASESVCANMTEGFYAQYSTEYLQSLFRCRREAREVMTHLRYVIDVCLLSKSSAGTVLDEYEASMRQLGALIGSIEEKIRERGKAKRGMVRESGVPECDPDLSTINH